MIEWCLLGVIAGTIAGLIPGLHSNNITVILATTPFFGIEVTSFILSMCVTQSLVEFIPATILGVPTENTFESILPAHKMSLEGRANEAIIYPLIGGITAVIIGVILTPVFFNFLEINNQQLILLTPPILIIAILVFVNQGKTLPKKLEVIFIILASTAQGIMFRTQIFALITGYFGVAGLIIALEEKNGSPKKQITKIELEASSIKYGLIGVCGGALTAVMPGIGSNTAGGIINTLKKIPEPKNYLTMLGAINMSNFFFSFATLLALNKARNGAMIAIQDKIFFGETSLVYGTIAMLFACGVGGIITIILAKIVTNLVNEKIQRNLNKLCILFSVTIVGFVLGVSGLIALIFSTALGLYTIKRGVRRSTLMSSLIVPTILFYLFILF